MLPLSQVIQPVVALAEMLYSMSSAVFLISPVPLFLISPLVVRPVGAVCVALSMIYVTLTVTLPRVMPAVYVPAFTGAADSALPSLTAYATDGALPNQPTLSTFAFSSFPSLNFVFSGF